MDQPEKEEELNVFQKLPFEKNEMILQNLDPISIINFGKNSKFCDVLAENCDDPITKISWSGSDDLYGPRFLNFIVQKFPDFPYILKITKSENEIGNETLVTLTRYQKSMVCVSFLRDKFLNEFLAQNSQFHELIYGIKLEQIEEH
ncbi:unnamed protein product [Caenorhabditis angaria]|uniref:Uncharacterized protein n=1 Tax=Caenorhabditis angaria TaxID=860376 RepID=A0A9P1ISH5_9PELO|nr:unnamed protein product [Caenorhabditis angaria]